MTTGAWGSVSFGGGDMPCGSEKGGEEDWTIAGRSRKSLGEKAREVLSRRKQKERNQEVVEMARTAGDGTQDVVLMDGSGIAGLVANKEVFSSYVEQKFRELDCDGDGMLSVFELQPAVADIGAALGLPAPGASPDSDHVYSEVLNEFTHGSHSKTRKSEFQKVFSDILLGMADGLKRDPIVILRIDGEDLREFVESLAFEAEAASIYTQLDSQSTRLGMFIRMALMQLTVDNGMPPASDTWVANNIVEPALSCVSPDQLQQFVPKEIFIVMFKKVLERIIQHLKEQPVFLAHSENIFDGSTVKSLLSDKNLLNKFLDAAWNRLPKHLSNDAFRKYLHGVLDEIAPSAGLPPFGALDKIDAVVNEAFRLVFTDKRKVVHEDEFKKLVTGILGSIMLQLSGSPINVCSDSVIHEPFVSSSTLLMPSCRLHGPTSVDFRQC